MLTIHVVKTLLAAADALLALPGHWTLDRRVLDLVTALHAEAVTALHAEAEAMLAKDRALLDPHNIRLR